MFIFFYLHHMVTLMYKHTHTKQNRAKKKQNKQEPQGALIAHLSTMSTSVKS